MGLQARVIAIVLAAMAVGCTPGDAPVSGGMRAYEPSLAVAQTGTFVAWHGGSGENSRIYVRRVDASGRPLGKAFAVSDGKRLAYEPDLIALPDGLAVAWYEKEPATGALSAWLAGVSPDGKRLWLAPLHAGSGVARNPVVRQVGDNLEVAWIEHPAPDDGSNRAEVWHQRLSLSGEPIAEPQRVGEANRDTWNLTAAADGNRLVVVYDAALGTRAHELHMLVMGDGEVIHRTLSEDDGHASLYPDLQFGPAGRAALTWFDERDGNQEVYLLAAPFEWLAEGSTPQPLRVSHSDAESIGAYVAWNGPVIGLAWSDDLSGGRDLFAQAFTADGQPLSAIRQIGPGRETAGVPVIRASGRGFLVAWNDYVAAGKGGHSHVAFSAIRLARLPAGG